MKSNEDGALGVAVTTMGVGVAPGVGTGVGTDGGNRPTLCREYAARPHIMEHA